MLPFLESHSRAVIAYRPLELRLLADKYDRQPAGQPYRATAPLFMPQNLERSRDLIAALWEVADAHAATPA